MGVRCSSCGHVCLSVQLLTAFEWCLVWVAHLRPPSRSRVCLGAARARLSFDETCVCQTRFPLSDPIDALTDRNPGLRPACWALRSLLLCLLWPLTLPIAQDARGRARSRLLLTSRHGLSLFFSGTGAVTCMDEGEVLCLLFIPFAVSPDSGLLLTVAASPLSS